MSVVLPLVVLALLQFDKVGVSASANDSYCVNYQSNVAQTQVASVPYNQSTRIYGAGDCLVGDVVLAGKYVNLGW